jgi:hypothetical protein
MLAAAKIITKPATMRPVPLDPEAGATDRPASTDVGRTFGVLTTLVGSTLVESELLLDSLDSLDELELDSIDELELDSIDELELDSIDELELLDSLDELELLDSLDELELLDSLDELELLLDDWPVQKMMCEIALSPPLPPGLYTPSPLVSAHTVWPAVGGAAKMVFEWSPTFLLAAFTITFVYVPAGST